MQLSGIRSFGPNEENTQKIRFFSPLTLFLGQNGCGKTTIIEALKFACTGDLPEGSNSGQGFVNDPKLNSSNLTKGQVRLKISDTKGNNITICKSIQVKLLPQNKLQFKRLDFTVKKKKPDGTESSLSSRCVDVNNICCEVLGVSKSILNNVIFCHQENSLWPLDDSKKLKEKFDEIFNITEYNAGLEAIRKKLKSKLDSMKNINEILDHRERLKNKVERNESRLRDKKTELETIKEVILKKKAELQPVVEELKGVTQIEKELIELEKLISSKETEINSLKTQQENVLKNIDEEFSGSEEELQNNIDLFNKYREKEAEKLNEREKEVEITDNFISSLRTNISKKEFQVGQLQKEKEQLENKEKKQLEQLQVISTKLAVPIYLCTLSTANEINEAINKNKSALKLEEEKLEKIEMENVNEEKLLQKAIDNYLQEQAQKNQEIVSKTQQIDENTKKIRELQIHLRDVKVSEWKLKTVAAKIANVDAELERYKKMSEESMIEAKIEEDKHSIIRLESKLAQMEKERKIVQKNVIIESDLENKNNFVLKRKADIMNLKDKYYEEFKLLFEETYVSYKVAIQKRKSHSENILTRLESENNMFESKKTRLKTQLEIKQNELKSLLDKQSNKQKQIDDVCRGKVYERYVNDVHLEIENLQKNKGEYRFGKIMYEKFVLEFDSKKCCPVCETSFGERNDAIKQIVLKIKTKIQKIPEKLVQIEKVLLEKQELYSKLVQLKSVKQEIEDLEVKKTELTVEIEFLKKQLQDLDSKITKIVEAKEIPTKLKNACNVVFGDIALIDQYNLDLTQTEIEIESLKSQLIPGSNRSLIELDEELENVREKLISLRKSIESFQKKIVMNNEHRRQLGEERSQLVEQQLHVHKAIQSQPQLQDRISELKEQEETLKKAIQEIKKNLETITAKLEEAMERKDLVVTTNKATLNSLKADHNRHEKLLEDIVKLQQEIKNNYESKIIENLNATLGEIVKMKAKERELTKQKEITLNLINQIYKKQENNSSMMRTLKDNISLRQLREEEKSTSKQLQFLVAKTKHRDSVSLQQRKQKLNITFITLQKDINSFTGQSDEMKKTITELETELKDPENVFAYKNYKAKLFEKMLTENLISDLKLYIQAFEASIIELHKERMKQINFLIRDLWRTIYRGSDVDYIKISTEESSGSQKRRTYNYRVVQCKNNIELDMRGRCSAGQKVLACLIIRMALSEAFSSNCGILALDEPTTNLDKENIVSLSQALATIVTTRRRTKTFQLLVISHDEEFLETLKLIDGVDSFYKVSRNINGNSVITREIL